MGESEFNYAKFSGPQRYLEQPLLEAEGWIVCHTSLFDDFSTAITGILVDCSGTELMLACRPSTGPNEFFVLAAYASRADVTFDTGANDTTTHNANGSEWYFNTNRSWGFAPKGATVEKATCDVEDFGSADLSSGYRMCIHIESGNLSEGLRCGDVNGVGNLNGVAT